MPPRPRSAARREQRTAQRTIIFDSGPLVALYSKNDEHHARCRDWFNDLTDFNTLIVPTTVLTEVAHMLTTKHKPYGAEAEASFLDDFHRGWSRGLWNVHALQAHELARSVEILRTYRDQKLGLVDASVIATAETYQTRYVASVERRFLPNVRPAHTDFLIFLPDH